MRRRAVLRAGLGLAGLTGAGLAGAHPGHSPTATPAARYAPLDDIPLPGAADCRVSADGETAYVAVGDGFVAVEVPALRPLAEVRSVAADREAGPLTNVADLALDGDRLLVPGPANPRPGRLAGFALFDVADPAAPEPVAFHETTFPIHNAALVGERAYLTAGGSLVVVDVADDDPVDVGRWSPTDVDRAWDDVPLPLRPLHDVRVRGDLAVLSLWDAGTWLVDVSSPDDVAVLGRAGGRSAAELAALSGEAVREAAFQLPGNHHSSALSADGTLLAVGAEAFDATGDGEGGPGGIDLYDVAEPTTPRRLSTIAAPVATDGTRAGTWTTAHDFAFDGDRLVSAWYQGGVRVHDVSEPTAPVELAWWRRPSLAAFWTARPAAGDTFVAPTTSLPGGDLVESLYLFPVRPGEQADPPPLTATPTPPTSSGRSPGRPSPHGSSVDASPTPTPTPTSSPTTTPGQPGFGAAGALGGLAGFAGLAVRGRWRGR